MITPPQPRNWTPRSLCHYFYFHTSLKSQLFTVGLWLQRKSIKTQNQDKRYSSTGSTTDANVESNHKMNSYGSEWKALWFFNALKALLFDVTQQLSCHSPQENHPTGTSAHRKLNPQENRPTRKLPRWISSHRKNNPTRTMIQRILSHRRIIPQENHTVVMQSHIYFEWNIF